MDVCYEEALKAASIKEVPVGACIVDEHGNLVSKAHNLKEANFDPTGHAEMIVIKNAATELKRWRLSDCTLYVSLEPCPMCISAMIQARVKRLVFGAYDRKGGAISLGLNIHQNPQLNHSLKVVGGLLHHKNSRLLSNFFRQLRSGYQNKG